MKTQKYQDNLEKMMKSYESKIREITAVITVAEYEEQVHFIKEQNERLGLLLEEKSNAILKMKEKMIKKLDKIQELEL